MVVMRLFFILLITGVFAVLADNSNTDQQSAADAVKKTIKSEDGDVIDCVDIYRQPAFSHPALKHHQIQMKPSFVPTSEKAGDRNPAVTKQKWHRSGSCPEGTVPIIRRPKTNSTFIIPRNNKPAALNQTKAVANLLRPNHSMSILLADGFAYLGAQADLGIYYPGVELDSEYTLTHITLETGTADNYEQVRSGWAVNPLVHKDRQTRFFVYWTADGSKKSGCFDSTCPGFVQTSSSIAPGAAVDLDPAPAGFPPPPIMTINIVKDPSTNNWWVQNGGHNVGYFPPSLFGALAHQASSVQWGGDVYSSHINGFRPHTSTDMGNGQTASRDFAAGIWRVRVLENSWALKYPEAVSTYADEYSCYNNALFTEFGDPEFYYGGPGLDPRCVLN